MTEGPLVIRLRLGAARREELAEALRPAAEALQRGGLVVYPTDTLYGLGADPFRRESVLRVYRAKRRPLDRPLPVLVASPEAAERLVEVTPEARRLMEALWPGGLTLILSLRPGAGLPSELHAGTGRLAVRMPRHEAALALIEEAGGALVGTSANIHGAPAPRTAEEALRQLGDAVEVVVDAGPAPLGQPSTIVDLTARPPRLIRRGAVAPSRIRELIGELAG